MIKWALPRAGSSRIFVVDFNISVLAEDCDFKLGRKLGIAKCNNKVTRKDKCGRVPRLRTLPESGGFL